jgi:hypothetical protein
MDRGGGGVNAVRQGVAIMLFELRRRARGTSFRVAALLIATASIGLGVCVYRHWLILSDAASLYRDAYLFAAALVFRFDVSHDIDTGHADLMAPNLIDVDIYVASRLAAGIAALVQFVLLAALLTALAPSLDLRFASWMGARWLLTGVLFAPAVALVERWFRTRLPVFAVALLLVVAVLVSASTGALEALPRLMGTRRLVYGSFGSLSALAWRAALIGVVGLVPVHLLLRRHWLARG